MAALDAPRVAACLRALAERDRLVTLTQRVAGNEVIRATGQVAASSHGEVIYVVPAAWVRQLPVVDVEVLLTAHEGGEEHPIGSYTLAHGGLLHRS